MSDDGNGKLTKEQPKTEEQLKEERLERYKKNPELFFETTEVILCCFRNPKSSMGVSAFVGRCKRQELDIADAELHHIANKYRIQMDVETDMKRQMAGGLIKPKPTHGMMNFARKIVGGK